MSNTKKSLLNENTIRRFMKLAEIDTLSDGFVSGLVKEQEEFGVSPDDGPADGPSGLEDTAELDMAPDEEPEAPEGAALTDAVSNLMGVISDMTGVDIDVDSGEVEDDMVDVDVEDELDVMAEDDTGRAPSRGSHQEAGRYYGSSPAWGGIGSDPKAGGIKSALAAARQQKKDESLQREANYRAALKQEVLRRVTGRLHEERRKDAVADQLSERILQRIKNQSKK